MELDPKERLEYDTLQQHVSILDDTVPDEKKEHKEEEILPFLSADPAVFVQFPQTAGVAFASHLLKFENEPTEENKDIEIPEVFLDREDLETPYDRSRAGELADQIWGRRLYILTEDLRRRKKMFLVFLVLDLTFCCIYLAAETMGSRSGDELLTFTSALLVTNVVIDILTFCGTLADSILMLNIFIMVEGLSIAVFLLRNFSPIVVLRLVVLFLAAQIRSRIKGISRYVWLGPPPT